MNLLKKIIDYGLLRAIKDSGGYFKRKSGYLDLKYRNIDKYKNPTDNELKIIEENFALLNLKTENLIVCKDDFDQFKKEYWFPENYHGGIDSVVYDEKLIEHFISHEILGIKHRNLMIMIIILPQTHVIQVLRKKALKLLQHTVALRCLIIMMM